MPGPKGPRGDQGPKVSSSDQDNSKHLNHFPLDLKFLHKVIFEKSVGNCGRWRTAWNSRKPREGGLFDRTIIPCIVLTILALLLLIFIFNVLFGFGIFFLGPVWTVWFNWYSRDAWTQG